MSQQNNSIEQKALILEYLHSKWEPFTDQLGKKNTEVIVDQGLAGVRTSDSIRHGSKSSTPFEFETTVSLIAAIASLVKSTIEIYRAVKNKNKGSSEESNKKEISDKVEAKIEEKDRIVVSRYQPVGEVIHSIVVFIEEKNQ